MIIQQRVTNEIEIWNRYRAANTHLRWVLKRQGKVFVISRGEKGVYTKAETHPPSRWTLADIWYERHRVGDRDGVSLAWGLSLLEPEGEKTDEKANEKLSHSLS